MRWMLVTVMKKGIVSARRVVIQVAGIIQKYVIARLEIALTLIVRTIAAVIAGAIAPTLIIHTGIAKQMACLGAARVDFRTTAKRPILAGQSRNTVIDASIVVVHGMSAQIPQIIQPVMMAHSIAAPTIIHFTVMVVAGIQEKIHAMVLLS